ncbi:MAG: 8-amino-7-oxononanoate synthase [Pirellulales bacterium]
MSDRLDWIDDELERLADADLDRHLHTHDGPQGPALTIDGRSLVNFGSNDYLALAGDSRLAAAASAAMQAEGFGSGSSPLIVGHAASHARLEQTLAEFEGVEAALLTSTGYAANVGAVTALVGRGDVVFSDALNHASLIDGCRLSRAEVRIYPHGDMETLAAELRDAYAFRRRLIVTDGLFSMDGDLAPLGDLAELAEHHEAMLLVDEAHATGVFGAQGRGTCEAAGVEEAVDVRIGTLSKALGAIGGFVAGRKSLTEWLVNRARSYIFSTALPPAAAAAAVAAIDLVRQEPQRRTELLARAAELRDALAGDGWDVGESGSQIIPLVVGEAGETMRLAARLRERGFLVPPIRPPSVPDGQCRLRLSLSYTHTPQMIGDLRAALKELR